jgi:hemoglobin
MSSETQREIVDRADVEVLVRTFYGRALSDEVLLRHFVELRFGELEHHVPKITDYWDSKLFDNDRYQGDALQVHRRIDAMHSLRADHFTRWLQLWVTTVDELFSGARASNAKRIAAQAATLMHFKIVGYYSEDLQNMLYSISGG